MEKAASPLKISLLLSASSFSTRSSFSSRSFSALSSSSCSFSSRSFSAHSFSSLSFSARSFSALFFSASLSLKTLLEDIIGSINLSCVSSYQRAPARHSALIRCMLSSTSMAVLGTPPVNSGDLHTIPRVPISVINTSSNNLRISFSSMCAFPADVLIVSS